MGGRASKPSLPYSLSFDCDSGPSPIHWTDPARVFRILNQIDGKVSFRYLHILMIQHPAHEIDVMRGLVKFHRIEPPEIVETVRFDPGILAEPR